MTDIRLCNKHCGCTSRKRRSFELPISENYRFNDIQTIEKLILAIIEVDVDVNVVQESHEVNSKQLFGSENTSRLRRSVDLESLNQFYSSVSERIDEIDKRFKG